MELKTAHTPGPWKDSGLPEQYDRTIVNEDGRAIAKVNHSAPATMIRASIIEEGRANARLIAAAPALLEALEGLLSEYMGRVGSKYEEDAEFRAEVEKMRPNAFKARDAARAAIALARGKTL